MTVFLSVMFQAPAPVQELDPAFESVAQRFFATQQAEDIEALGVVDARCVARDRGARAAVRETEAGRAPAAWAGWIVISGR